MTRTGYGLITTQDQIRVAALAGLRAEDVTPVILEVINHLLGWYHPDDAAWCLVSIMNGRPTLELGRT